MQQPGGKKVYVDHLGVFLKDTWFLYFSGSNSMILPPASLLSDPSRKIVMLECIEKEILKLRMYSKVRVTNVFIECLLKT